MGSIVALIGTALLMVGLQLWPVLQRWFPVDRPGGRKLQVKPIPLVGIIPATVAVLAFGIAGWLLEAVVVAVAALVGFLDDSTKHRSLGLGWHWKLLPLLLASALGAHAVVPVQEAPLLAVAVFVFLFVVINGVNFLDNTDGVCLTVVVLGLLLAAYGMQTAENHWLDHPAAWAAFGALGLLPFNWPKARVYLGDAGALGLGCALGLMAARSAFLSGGELRMDNGLPTLDLVSRCIAPVLLPLLDFTQVVLMRIWLGVPPWIGDRRHLTHIAMSVGLPRTLVAPMVGLLILGGDWLFGGG